MEKKTSELKPIERTLDKWIDLIGDKIGVRTIST